MVVRRERAGSAPGCGRGLAPAGLPAPAHACAALRAPCPPAARPPGRPCAPPAPRPSHPPVLKPRPVPSHGALPPAPFPHEAVPAHRRVPRPSHRHGFTHLPSVFSSRLVFLSRIDHLVFYLRLRESARSLAGDWGAPTAHGCSPLLQFNASPPFSVWGRPAPGRRCQGNNSPGPALSP